MNHMLSKLSIPRRNGGAIKRPALGDKARYGESIISRHTFEHRHPTSIEVVQFLRAILRQSVVDGNIASPRI